MKPRFHCFFEQSGTFKNEFKKLGYEAYDYDILNDFGETDYQVDLFRDIEKAYEGSEERTVFDNVQEGDQIIAFFPCIRFEDQIIMNFQGKFHGNWTWDDEKKLEYDIRLHNELHKLYCMVTKLAIVCIRKKIPLIIENPRGTQHYLNRYWCLSPAVIDSDRRERGDYFKKPTQFWFVGRRPSNNLIFEALGNNAIKSSGKTGANKRSDSWHNRRKADYEKTGASTIKEGRSMIHPDYANRFIREFII